MKLIAEGKKIFDFFNEDCTLLSSSLIKLELINVHEDLTIKFSFSLQHPKNNIITLEFSEIENYSFCLDSDNYFYNVESYKFFEIENKFYLSLDPYDELERISKKDNDCVLSKKIVMYQAIT